MLFINFCQYLHPIQCKFIGTLSELICKSKKQFKNTHKKSREAKIHHLMALAKTIKFYFLHYLTSHFLN